MSPPFKLAVIPEGWFRMGDANGREAERPVHEVRVNAFAIAETTVSNQQYREFAKSTARAAAPLASKPGFDEPRQPVVAVSWFDAMAYCDWLSAEAGSAYRLPTEAEWERAARGGAEGCLYPWGDDPPDRSSYPALHAPLDHPLSVATTEPNGYGLYEMCMNVHEWCADWYDPDFYAHARAENPINMTPGSRRASRGGSWRHAINYSRVAARSSIPPEYRYADYGFRVVCPID